MTRRRSSARDVMPRCGQGKSFDCRTVGSTVRPTGSIILLPLQQLVVRPERQPQQPVGISGAGAGADADTGVTAIKSRADSKTHAAAVAVFDPIRDGSAVTQFGRLVRWAEFRHGLV